ncbi:MAG TPA: hypothetical protein VFK05_20725 [Polyangiaceae bacterium]|nr:hypothetical protein [Polyangiaceae bacterium]
MYQFWIGVAIPAAVLFTLAPRVCAASAASEETPDAPPTSSADRAPEVRRWYGWQTFTTDGVAGALFLGAIAADYNSTLFGLSGVSFGLGTPAVHLAHGHWGVAIGSLGMRILGPFVGAAIGASGDVRYQDYAGGGGGDTSGKWTAIGAGIGGLVVSTIDGALLAYDRESPRPARNQLLLANSLPQVVVLRHGIGLGYSGQF